MGEKIKPGEKEFEDEFVGEIKPESQGYEGNGLYITDVHRQDLPKEELDKRLSMVEEYLGGGASIAELIASRVVAEPTFVSLFNEYYEGKRKDPNNYKKLIKDYYYELNQQRLKK